MKSSKYIIITGAILCICFVLSVYPVMKFFELVGIDQNKEIIKLENFNKNTLNVYISCVNEYIFSINDCFTKEKEHTNQIIDQKNLEIQQEIAVLTAYALILSIFNFFVSSVGILFIYESLRMNFESTALANKSVRLADKSIADNRYLSEIEIGAHVFVSRASIYCRADGTIAFRVYFTNTGPTPAKNINFGGEVNVNRDGTKRTDSIPTPKVWRSIPYIGCGKIEEPSTIHDRKNLEREDSFVKSIEEVRQNPGKRFLILRGSVKYESIFGKRFRTDFEFYVNKIENLKPGKSQQMTILPPSKGFHYFQKE